MQGSGKVQMLPMHIIRNTPTISNYIKEERSYQRKNTFIMKQNTDAILHPLLLSEVLDYRISEVIPPTSSSAALTLL